MLIVKYYLTGTSDIQKWLPSQNTFNDTSICVVFIKIGSLCLCSNSRWMLASFWQKNWNSCNFRHGLLYIWAELMSIFFWWSAHMRRELGTQITPQGWIFWTKFFYHQKISCLKGPRFEPCQQLWKKLFQDESSDSHNREWDESARTNRGLA